VNKYELIEFGEYKALYRVLYKVEMSLYAIALPLLVIVGVSGFMPTPTLFEFAGTILLLVLSLAILTGKKVDNLRHEIASLKQSLRIED